MGVVHLLVSFLLTSSADNSLKQPPPPDSTPTAWACTVETLINGKDCVFEAESPQSAAANQAKDNVKFAKQLADVACARAIAGDGSSSEGGQACRREFAKAADGCGLSGKSSLVDSKGRFSPAARSCYVSLSTVLQRSSIQVALADACCECVNSGQCKSASAQCSKHLANGAPTSAEAACMRGACAKACSGVAGRGGEL